ncbi:hypothetical protein BH23ACT8_BH23ACT8_05940 [soil metagenome]
MILHDAVTTIAADRRRALLASGRRRRVRIPVEPACRPGGGGREATVVEFEVTPRGRTPGAHRDQEESGSMRVLVAGSHGKIGQRLTRRLAEAGHEPVAMIRDEEQADEMAALGGHPLVADLAGDVAHAVAAVDAVVFTAGAGPGSGPGPKQTIDRGGAEKLVDAAKAQGVRRFVTVSSMGADDPASASEQMRPYQEAKRQADDYVAASGLDWTIVRPGGLTDEPGDGRVAVAGSLGRGGKVSRDDVAAVLVAVLADDRTIGLTFEVLDGDDDIPAALVALAVEGDR